VRMLVPMADFAHFLAVWEIGKTLWKGDTGV
jgi:hypothetical protein